MASVQGSPPRGDKERCRGGAGGGRSIFLPINSLSLGEGGYSQVGLRSYLGEVKSTSGMRQRAHFLFYLKEL